MKKGRKASGGKYKKAREKKLYEKKGNVRKVKLGEKKTKTIKTRGGSKKLVSLTGNTINIMDEKKAIKAKIANVLETPSNRFLARQNILTKGSIVETDLGKAKITNRPSQEGIIQGILIEKA